MFRVLTNFSYFPQLSLICFPFLFQVPPQPPTNLAVTNILARSAQIRFNPGDDGDAPVTTWTVNYRHKENSNWTWLVNITDSGSERR